MRKTINLYFKFHFTSLALDAQPISMGVVSEDRYFYAEFSDYNIHHCDDWVKDNIISKLIYPDRLEINTECEGLNAGTFGNTSMRSNTDTVKVYLEAWLRQFKDYNIQFVMDYSQLGWLWMTELLDERPPVEDVFLIPETAIPNNMTSEEFIKELKKRDRGVIIKLPDPEIKSLSTFKLGLPELPSNVVVVPQDLNELIAFKEKVTIKEAFDLSRKKLALNPALYDQKAHNALYDAEVIRDIYLQLR